MGNCVMVVLNKDLFFQIGIICLVDSVMFGVKCECIHDLNQVYPSKNLKKKMFFPV